MRTRKTLEDRIRKRVGDTGGHPPFTIDHIRAEYALLARRVRKLRKLDAGLAYYQALTDVLALVKELRK